MSLTTSERRMVRNVITTLTFATDQAIDEGKAIVILRHIKACIEELEKLLDYEEEN